MVQVSDLALEKLSEYMNQNNITTPIRITVMGGCSGPALGLAVDEKKDSDEVVVMDKLTFLIEENLSKECGDVAIDFVDAGPKSGFSITSTNPLQGAGCNPNSCGSGGCGC